MYRIMITFFSKMNFRIPFSGQDVSTLYFNHIIISLSAHADNVNWFQIRLYFSSDTSVHACLVCSALQINVKYHCQMNNDFFIISLQTAGIAHGISSVLKVKGRLNLTRWVVMLPPWHSQTEYSQTSDVN